MQITKHWTRNLATKVLLQWIWVGGMSVGWCISGISDQLWGSATQEEGGVSGADLVSCLVHVERGGGSEWSLCWRQNQLHSMSSANALWFCSQIGSRTKVKRGIHHKKERDAKIYWPQQLDTSRCHWMLIASLGITVEIPSVDHFLRVTSTASTKVRKHKELMTHEPNHVQFHPRTSADHTIISQTQSGFNNQSASVRSKEWFISP